MESGKLTNTLSGHTDGINRLAIENGRIISGSYDSIKVWDVESGRLINNMIGHVGVVDSIAIENSKIVTGSDDTTIKIWDIESGRCINTITDSNVPHSLVIKDNRVIVAILREAGLINVGIAMCENVGIGENITNLNEQNIFKFYNGNTITTLDGNAIPNTFDMKEDAVKNIYKIIGSRSVNFCINENEYLDIMLEERRRIVKEQLERELQGIRKREREKQEKERIRMEEEQQESERIQREEEIAKKKYRKDNGLCVICGVKLGMLEKLVYDKCKNHR